VPHARAARPLLARLRGLSLAALAVLACAHAPARPVARTIAVETGSARTSEGVAVAYEVGTMFVPENRLNPASRTIGVGFARIKAARPTGAAPIFLLVGGPGVTMLETLADHDDASRRRLKMWAEYAADADLVVIEQRGSSTPPTPPAGRPSSSPTITATTTRGPARSSPSASPAR
jgi:hypothetical protein